MITCYLISIILFIIVYSLIKGTTLFEKGYRREGNKVGKLKLPIYLWMLWVIFTMVPCLNLVVNIAALIIYLAAYGNDTKDYCWELDYKFIKWLGKEV